MITLGSDVEVAIVHGHVPVDVSGMLGCSKDEPAWYNNFNIQEDNVNAEYAINPVSSLEDWEAYHTSAINQVRKLLPYGHDILFQPATYYTDAALQSDTCKVFGCDPDFSAWSGMPNRAPNINRAKTLRTCGGHIHVGGLGDARKEDVAKWMDIMLGLPALFMDTDTERRKLYGKAGSYRPKAYGLEYRTLSNFWAQTEEGRKWAYDQTIKAVEFSFTGMLTQLPNLHDIPRCINTYDLSIADSLMNWLTKEGIV